MQEVTLEELRKLHGHDCDILYKEAVHAPYIASKQGVLGTPIWRPIRDEVICNECGWSGKALGPHIKQMHKEYKKVRDYKTRHGLFQKVPLVSKSHSRVLRENALKQKNKSTQFKKAHPRLNRGRGIYKKAPMMYNNLRDCCPLQIERRLMVVAKTCGKTVQELKSGDIRQHDNKLYVHLSNTYGNVNNWCSKYKITYSFKRGYDITSEDLIAKLRAFVVKNGYIPSTRSWQRRHKKNSPIELLSLPSYQTYISRFGSWERTKTVSGLHELLQEVLIQRSQQKVLDRL